MTMPMLHLVEWRRASVAAALLSVVSAAPVLAQGAPAWDGGKLFVPAALSTTGAACESAPGGACASQIKPGKHPVIVFLHGCGGPRSPKTFFDLGAIVVAPNSFASGARCEADANAIVKLLGKRYEDVKFTAAKLKDASWADPGKLVLAGYSNGAQTTATYPGEEFRARVIVAWTCNNARRPEQNGIKGKGPVLAVLGTADEFYKKIGLSGDCSAAAKARGETSRSVLIPGGGHEILDHATTREAVAAFVPVALR
jgi:dienelactone hydrolase